MAEAAAPEAAEEKYEPKGHLRDVLDQIEGKSFGSKPGARARGQGGALSLTFA